jgi:hypothetical protein
MTPARSGRAPRVPGFPQPSSDRAPDPTPEQPAQIPPVQGPVFDRRAGTKQLNVRLVVELLDRYRGLARSLVDRGYETTLSELIHAVLLSGPSNPEEARSFIREWRRAMDPDQ